MKKIVISVIIASVIFGVIGLSSANVFGLDSLGIVSGNSHSDSMSKMMTNGMMGSMMSGGNMMGNGGMQCSMMTDSPQDVIIKVKSSQQVSAGKESHIILLVTDKNKTPLNDARVIVGIERGAPMSTMDMMGGMFSAENIGNGKYIVKFTLDTAGYYTLHTHVIPSGKSMHSMMENHMDIGIIAK